MMHKSISVRLVFALSTRTSPHCIELVDIIAMHTVWHRLCWELELMRKPD